MRSVLSGCLLVLLAGAVLAQDVPLRPYYVRRGRYVYVVTRPDWRGAATPLVPVGGPPRLDWKFAATPAFLADMPKEPPAGFAAARADGYQLIVPSNYQPETPPGLLLFLGAATPEELLGIATICQKQYLAFTVPVGMGDEVKEGVRLKRAVEVLDDVRRRLVIDTDRIYLAGTYGGAVTASRIAHSFPELCGGLLAIGGTTTLRAEPYLRERVARRLAVVLMAGQLDPARHELERYRLPVLRDSGVNAKMIVVPTRGRGLPPPGVIELAINHLEEGKVARAGLMKLLPAMRIAEKSMPPADAWAKALLGEGKKRLKSKRDEREALMVLHGVSERWPAGPAAEAKRLLEKHDEKSPVKWRDVYAQKQLDHYLREASALDEYYKVVSTIPGVAKLGAPLKDDVVRMWEQVAHFGRDTPHGKRADARLEALRKAR